MEVQEMSKKKSSGERARSAVTGRFVKKGFAKRNLKTTVVEKVKKQKNKL